MTDKEITAFREGYGEHRRMLRDALGDILKLNDGHYEALEGLVIRITQEMEADHWRDIQNESPGITKEEYETQLDIDRDEIIKTYYSEAGFLKPRLVRN